MVREANEKQAAAEKALKESQMKVDVLTAEVAALKTLVLTSTPSSPNPHLHPQICKDETGKDQWELFEEVVIIECLQGWPCLQRSTEGLRRITI